MSDPCKQCEIYEDEIVDLKSDQKSSEKRITALEKALDDVLCEINFARADLDDAEKIVGMNT